MRVIDSDDYKASGIETFFFPGGEPHARIPENFGDALLFLKPRTWNDIGIAMCVLNALYYQGHTKVAKVWLFCPYFPGARQDRTDYRTPVTREIMGRMMGQYVHRFYTFDLHSSVHCQRLQNKGFASTNVVFGCGSYNYQYVTRDTYGFAMKATWAQVNGQPHELFKDPVTDDGTKRSARGRLAVTQDAATGELQLWDGITRHQGPYAGDQLEEVWCNGRFKRQHTLDDIRKRLRQ